MVDVSNVILNLKQNVKSQIDIIDNLIKLLNSQIENNVGDNGEELDENGKLDREDAKINLDRDKARLITIAGQIDESLNRMDELEVSKRLISNSKGANITEETFKIEDLIHVVKRATIINGLPISYFKATIGDFDIPNMEAEFEFEGNEIVGENIQSSLGYYQMAKYQGLEGDYLEQSKHDNDVLLIKSKNSYDGFKSICDRPMLDKEGNVIGKYKEAQYSKKQIGGFHHTESSKVMQRTVMTSEGPVVIKTEISSDGEGDYNRIDSLNGEEISTQSFDELDNSFDSLLNSQAQLADLSIMPQEISEALLAERLDKTINTIRVFKLSDDEISKLKEKEHKAEAIEL